MSRRRRLLRLALIPSALLGSALLLGLSNTLQPLETDQLPEVVRVPRDLALPIGGDNPLGAPQDELEALQDGFELVFAGDYRGAWAFFEGHGAVAPDSPVGPLGETGTFLAARYAGEPMPIDYAAAHEATAETINHLVADESWTPWARTLDAMHQGVDGLFASNRGEYLVLLERCQAVLNHLDALEEEAPDFVDAKIASGLFDYWWTVIAHELPYVPAWRDRRASGLAELQEVARDATLVRGPAAFGLALSLVDAGYPDEALPWAQALRDTYPASSLAAMAWDLSSVPEWGEEWSRGIRSAMNHSEKPR